MEIILSLCIKKLVSGICCWDYHDHVLVGCIIISLVIRVTTSGQGLLTCAGWSPLPRTRHQPFNFRKIKSTNIYNTLQATASPLDTHCLQRHRKHVQVSSRNCFYWRIQVYVLLFMIKNPCCQGRCLCSAKYLSSINTGSFVLTILHLTIIIMNYSERARLLLLAFHITVTTASGLVLTTPPTESCRKVNPFSSGSIKWCHWCWCCTVTWFFI